MIRLVDRTLPVEVQVVLDGLQKHIDDEASFVDKTTKAQSLWKSKGNRQGEDAFEIVKAALLDLCVFVGICNYCEQNEANDIEHIFPKSFFPEKTFVWSNYLLACKQCNSGYKLDKIHVLDDNDAVAYVQRGTPPPSQRVAFINPRTVDPSSYLLLNLHDFKFDSHPEATELQQRIGGCTCEILQLNDRAPLIAARKSAYRFFWEVMDRLFRILQAPDKPTLDALLPPMDPPMDTSGPLELVKAEILENHRKLVSTYQHPSVWHAIKVIEAESPRWKPIFTAIPEALTW